MSSSLAFGEDLLFVQPKQKLIKTVDDEFKNYSGILNVMLELQQIDTIS